jgi:hypothetical protein
MLFEKFVIVMTHHRHIPADVMWDLLGGLPVLDKDV